MKILLGKFVGDVDERNHETLDPRGLMRLPPLLKTGEQLKRNCPFIVPLTAGKKFNFTSKVVISSKS